ncbi:uncharacterized protein V1516DRAFT_354365 [Lipomyces oligophaga]|uniref:uncharacterized protein n=1 Tax=Lipomyces oligophaga TaxID=45792 RepID=UPI0034CE397F
MIRHPSANRVNVHSLPTIFKRTITSRRTLSTEVELKQAAAQSSVLTQNSNDPRKTLVILGSGWGGFNVLRNIDPHYYRCVVVSPRSYFVFTPLLASTAVGTLEFRLATVSIRDKGLGWRKLEDWREMAKRALSKSAQPADKVITTKQAHEMHLPNLELVQGIATSLDPVAKELVVAPRIMGVDPTNSFSIRYDKLVIAVGSYSQTFNIKGVKENAFFLKDVADARKIRSRILERFEAANLFIVSEQEKRALLNFCIVGGGPTGVEFAAELHDLIHEDMQFLYPSLMPFVSITIFDVAEKILGSFDKSLGSYAEKYFGRQDITIRTRVSVTEVFPEHMTIRNPDGSIEDVRYGLLVWSTGLAANPFVERIDGFVKDKRNNLLTNDTLNPFRKTSSGDIGAPDEDVYALGDCAQIDRNRLPATAQVASQKAVYLAHELNREAKTRYYVPHKTFSFNNRGIMAYLGGWRAILQGGGESKGNLHGRTAWILWRGAYLSMSVSFKNKILIPIFWIANWLFGRDINRF